MATLTPPLFSINSTFPSVSPSPSSLHRRHCLPKANSFLRSPLIHHTELSNVSERRRGAALVVRAGPPSTTSLIFAFVFPLSLIIGTIIASVRIADRLDEKYLEELEMNRIIIEEAADEMVDEKDGASDEEDGDTRLGEEAVTAEVDVSTPLVRNRPRRFIQ